MTDEERNAAAAQETTHDVQDNVDASVLNEDDEDEYPKEGNQVDQEPQETPEETNIEHEDREGEEGEEEIPEQDTNEVDYQDLSSLKARKRSNAPQSGSRETSTTPGGQSQSQNQLDDSRSFQYNDDYDEDQRPVDFREVDAATKRRQELEAKLDRALKKPKMKRRKGEEDLTNDEDELIQILKNQMDEAAKKDVELNENNQGIAINKIQLLPKVTDILSKANLAEVILDNNLLAEVRQWLEPLPDASLPSYEIQKTLFAALLKLPISTNHLRESGIGKVLLFYQKSKRVEPKIKRVADKLISDWTRPIIGASDNYRDKQFHSIDYDAQRHRKKLKHSADKVHIKESEKSIYEQQAARRGRAAAPVPTVSDYRYAPKSRLDRSGAQAIQQAGVGTTLNRDDQFKRINQRLTGRKGKVGGKKSGVSIDKEKL
ncbi:Transcription factor [Wickerhamomyces ciferrii]|uniref:Transcription factor n=1 Tax=Wickerhamomyces ciferrii (strain ATCC 14091 / BCRC 22168 / CBS 111 / JCM 3599 / NBRC 0793 / NRRL Y-1031 F-60-10) TaxID=1206466 RepID=K0KMH6_WICCF|nr:Transcription factor [Wickerhamomyces ciferrii]CCH42298.1 Transcription factor [Wickerhamomyces ciferrii]